MDIKRAVSVALASLGAFSIAFGQNDGSVKSSSGGGNRYINNTQKKRSKSYNKSGKPKKISSKSGNKTNQTVANFNQNIKDVDKTRPRSKSVGMSTGKKVGLGVGVPLGFGGVITGLGFGIKHLIRKYGKCDLFRNCSFASIDSQDVSSWDKINYKISFIHDYKNSKNFKKFVLNFFLAKNEYVKYYLVYKITEDSIENGVACGLNIAKDGGLENLSHAVFEKVKDSSGNFLLLNNGSSIYGKEVNGHATDAFNCVAGKLADIIVEEAKNKLDDCKINVAYETDEGVKKLKDTMKNMILERLDDFSGKLVFTCVKDISFSDSCKNDIDKLKQLGWSVIDLR